MTNGRHRAIESKNFREVMIKPKKQRKKYPPLPKSNTEREMLEQIRKELPSDMDTQINKQEVKQND